MTRSNMTGRLFGRGFLGGSLLGWRLDHFPVRLRNVLISSIAHSHGVSAGAWRVCQVAMEGSQTQHVSIHSILCRFFNGEFSHFPK